jgi:hypothetical protein
LCQQSLASTGWSDEKNVRFLNFDVRTSTPQLDAFVMLVDGYGEALLGFVLADYVFVKKVFDLARFGQRWSRRNGFGLLIVRDDLVADINALVADIDGRTGNEFLNFILRLTTE